MSEPSEWYPAIVATLLNKHPTIAIDLTDTETTEQVRAQPGMSAVPSLTLVTAASGTAHARAAFAAAGWREVAGRPFRSG